MLPRQIQLVAHGRHHDLEQGEQRGEAGDGERAEKQHTENGATRHLINDGGEGDKRQADAAGGRIFHGGAALGRHEPQCREHADARQHFERGVSERGHHASTGQVGTWLEIGGVGHHDAETHRQRVENLPVGGDPHRWVGKGRPVGREESVQAVGGALQEQGTNHHNDEEHGQNGHKDLRCLPDARIHTHGKHDDRGDPHDSKGDKDGPHEFGGQHMGGVLVEEFFLEILFRLVTPG